MITYDDIRQEFSVEDLSRYNLLCGQFVRLSGNKNNIQLWEMVQDDSDLRLVLDEIHILRERYKFLKGTPFFTVWRAEPKDGKELVYEELSW